MSEWLRRIPRHKEMSNSQTKEGFVDLPLDAAAWLVHFKMQNQAHLKADNVSNSIRYTLFILDVILNIVLPNYYS